MTGEEISIDTPGGDSYETYVLEVRASGEEAMPYDEWKLIRELMSRYHQYVPTRGWSSFGTKFADTAVKSDHAIQDQDD